MIVEGGYNLRVVASGLGFIEGPVVTDDGRLLVVDLSCGWIQSIDIASGRCERMIETGGGPNGLALGPDGALFVCNTLGLAFEDSAEGLNVPVPGKAPSIPGPAGILHVGKDQRVSPLYMECGGHPLVAPNDLVFDAHGGFYFTDMGGPLGRNCDLGGLYYAKSDGSAIVELIHESSPTTPLTQPNGVALSPAGDRLYVTETVTGRIWAWNIAEPGVLACGAQSMSPNGAEFVFGYDGFAMFDSMAVDSEGYLCVATIIKGGISVISPEGRLKDFIALPEYDPFVTNICFGGPDMQTAYVTAARSGKVWALDWPRDGLRLNHA